MSTINDLSPDDVRQLAQLAGQEWDDAAVERLLPQVKGVLNAGKRIYDLDLGGTELAVSFELEGPRT
jgi:Asp-tRNA(Asn)/Glu-tRNA(Gln) amidotransferase C subunit